MSFPKLDMSMSLKEANETKLTLAEIVISFLAREELSAEQRNDALKCWITSSTLIEQNTVRRQPKG